jgi:predicted nucleotidyltransferase
MDRNRYEIKMKENREVSIMVEGNHEKAIASIVSSCQNLAVISILVYGSYARGDYRPDSDIDLLAVVDSKRYSSSDLKRLVEICRFCKEEFEVKLEMDIILDSEIELWNKGILLDGHSFIDLSFYNKEGKVIFGEDIRARFKLPENFREKSHDLLKIIDAEFKKWFLESEEIRSVPHWMTGWLLVTYLNTLGVTDVTSFEKTCELIKEITFLATTPEFSKYHQKKELTPDEFINLKRIIQSETHET